METFPQLKKKRTVRRLIEAAGTVLSLAALIVFAVLKEKSKVIEKIEITPFLSYDSVSYTRDFSIPILISAVIFALFFSFLFADLLCARIYRTVIDNQEFIIYHGIGPIRLLVNGEERDAMLFKGYLETKLKSGVTVTASPQFFLSYHLVFSDNRPAVDL